MVEKWVRHDSQTCLCCHAAMRWLSGCCISPLNTCICKRTTICRRRQCMFCQLETGCFIDDCYGHNYRSYSRIVKRGPQRATIHHRVNKYGRHLWLLCTCFLFIMQRSRRTHWAADGKGGRYYRHKHSVQLQALTAIAWRVCMKDWR